MDTLTVIVLIVIVLAPAAVQVVKAFRENDADTKKDLDWWLSLTEKAAEASVAEINQLFVDPERKKGKLSTTFKENVRSAAINSVIDTIPNDGLDKMEEMLGKDGMNSIISGFIEKSVRKDKLVRKGSQPTPVLDQTSEDG